MKILIVANSFPRPFDYNMGSYTYSQAEAIQDLGHEVVVVSPDPYIPSILSKISKRFRKHVELEEIYQIKKMIVHYPKMLQYGKFLRGWVAYKVEYKLYEYSVYSFVKDLAVSKKIDCMIGIGFHLEGNLVKNISVETGIPFSIIEHSNTDILWAAESVVKANRYLEIAERADYIFFVSSKSKKLFEEKIGYIKNSIVNLNGFDMPQKVICNRKNDAYGKLVISSVGFLEERKGHKKTLDVLKEIKSKIDFDFYLIGTGSQEAELKRIINNYGINNQCHLLGKLPREEVYEILSKSDIFVLLSKYEPLGIVYLEAMYFRNIVIATKDEGISDVIDNGENGFLVNPDDVAGICNIIQKLSRDPITRERVSSKAHKKVLELTWQRNAKCLVDILGK